MRLINKESKQIHKQILERVQYGLEFTFQALSFANTWMNALLFETGCLYFREGAEKEEEVTWSYSSRCFLFPATNFSLIGTSSLR